MRFKQKLAYMALGGALVFAGMLLPTILINTAQTQGSSNGNFHTVTAQNLKIVDADGNVLVKLGKARPSFGGGGYLNIYDDNQTVLVSIGTDKNGGYVDINDKTGDYGKRAVILRMGQYGGRIDLYQADGTPASFVGSSSYGGVLQTYNKKGNRASMVGVDRAGVGVLLGYVIP